MRFFKMNGLGNDYIFIDEKQFSGEAPKLNIPFLCDRHKGVGSDGVVLFREIGKNTLSMKIFNVDGTEAEMCGNALRCLIRHVGAIGKEITVHTKAGVKTGLFNGITVSINLGKPVSYDTELRNIVINGKIYCGKRVNVGNPHFVIEKPYDDELARSISECTAFFPSRTNVEFVTKTYDGYNARVYERGCGETLACGTGAAAVLIASGKAETNVHLSGGTLVCKIEKEDIIQIGSAEYNFEGEINV